MYAVTSVLRCSCAGSQYPGTWCFLPIHGPQSTADSNLALAFSCLGLTALILSILCNTLSGLALLQARMKSHCVNTISAACRTRRALSATSSSLFCSLDVEMMAQLAGITVVSTTLLDYRISFHFCCYWAGFFLRKLIK